jgi:hypothetical protein
VTQTLPEPPRDPAPSALAATTPPVTAPTGATRLGVDWWAVIVGGVFVALAVLDVLPKIPW